VDLVICCFHTSKKTRRQAPRKISLREHLVQFSNVLQTAWFDRLEQELGPLSEKAQGLVSVLEMVSLSRWIAPRRGWRGRPCRDRQAVGAGFLAQAIYGLETTRQVLERLQTDRQLRCLCGWNEVHQIPHGINFLAGFGGIRRQRTAAASARSVD
jgi:hypothetical protein